MLIISAIEYLADMIFESLFYDINEFTQRYIDWYEVYEQFLNNGASYDEVIDSTLSFCSYGAPLLIFSFITSFVVGFIYLVIIPYFTSFQTLGRAAMKIRVVDASGKKCSFGRLILREVLGTLILVPIVLTLCYGIPIIILICLSRRSISDVISTTYTMDFSKKEFVEELINSISSNDQFENTVRPDYKDVNNDYYSNERKMSSPICLYYHSSQKFLSQIFEQKTKSDEEDIVCVPR